MITFSDNIARKPYLGSTEIAEVWLGNVKVYPDTPTDYSRQYLTFDILQSGNIGYTMSTNTLQYSKNGGATWTNGSPNTNIHVNAGDKVLVKFTNPVLYKQDNTYTEPNGVCKFYTTCNFNLYGNVMSLIYGDDFPEHVSFQPMQDNYGNTVDMNHLLNLFFGCSRLISAENLVLPATILKEQCYCGMFQSCSSLTTAPSVLPAAYVTAFSYAKMFDSCTSLVNAPVLPATTVGRGGYSDMFYGCTSLVNAPELPATSLGIDCYQEMFLQCNRLVNIPSILPATTLANGCYSSMFSGCTSLTTAPELPATTLVSQCYNYMFDGCTSLNYIKAMFTTTPSTTYTSGWVDGVAATGTFVKNKNATWNVTGDNGVPTGWVIETEQPKIYKKYRATYSDGTTVDGDCDGNNLVRNEITKSGLKTVVIGECVPAIVGECFSDCANLTSVIIEGNTSIDDYSFTRNNGHLTSITMYSTTPPPCKSTAFTYYNGGYVPMTSIKIYVPSQSVNAYKAASGWSTYASKIQAIP